MRLHRPRLRSALLVTMACGAFAGCLVVTPLDDLPEAVGGAGPAGSAQGGSSQSGAAHGGAPDAGEAGAASAGAPDPGGNQCETNADCVRKNADEPARCRPSDHTCVTLRDDFCPVVWGDSADPNAIFFGAFATLNPSAPEENPIVWAHELALEELSGNNVGGLLGGPNGTRRPLVMLLCSNAEDVEPALSHLVDDVEVPAVIATLKPGDLRHGFETHRKRDVFYLSPVAVTQTVAIEPDDDLIWNMLGQPGDLAPTYTALLARDEAFVRAVRKLPATTDIKVALVTTLDAFDFELGNAVEPVLSFNGHDTTWNLEADNYRAFTLDPDDPQLAAQAQALVEFRPDIVVSTASELFAMPGGLLQQIEMAWGDPTIGGTPEQQQNRPFYILSPYNAGNLGPTEKLIGDFIEGNEVDANQRFIGVSIAGPENTSLQRAYETRLRKLFEHGYPDSANYYDAIYFLAYAMYGADEPQLTGSGIARGMQRLLSGQSFAIGPAAIGDVFNALAVADASVDVQSTLGPPSFDAETGVRRVDGSVFCFSAVGAVTHVTDVLRYDRAKGTLVGKSFPCFSGFYP
jgi:hypothetical protein